MDGEQLKRDVAAAVRWYEESPGVTSSTRIFTAIAFAFTAVVLVTTVGYMALCLFRVPHEKPDGNILATLAGALTTLAATAASLVATRNKGC